MSLPTPGDRAAETSTTTGTGTYSLAGAISGWRTLVAACGDGAVVDYFVRDQAGGANYEVGRGTVTDLATDTLSRDTIYASSNGDAAVNWSAGTREIVVTLTAQGFNELAGAERKNALINGDFKVWQEGDSFASVSTTDYSADMWKWVQAGTGVVDIARITASLPTVAEAGRFINNGLQVDVTTADASIAAGDNYAVRGIVEGYDFAPFAQRPMVASFWHKHTKTGTYCVALRNSGIDRSYVAEYTQTTTNTWERAEIQILASPSAGTWDYTTGIGVELDFTIASGTTFHTTAGAWQTGNFIATSNQVNGMDAATNFFRIAGVQLEQGTVATDFENLHFAEAERLAQRYFKIRNGLGYSGIVRVADRVLIGMENTVEMRSSPTLTLLDTTPTIAYDATSQDGVSSTILSSTVDTKSATLTIGGFSGLTVGNSVLMNSSADLLSMDARL